MEYQHMMVDIYKGQWLAGEDNVWLNNVQEDANATQCCGDLRCQGSWSGATVQSDFVTTKTMTTTTMMMMIK